MSVHILAYQQSDCYDHHTLTFQVLCIAWTAVVWGVGRFALVTEITMGIPFPLRILEYECQGPSILYCTIHVYFVLVVSFGYYSRYSTLYC